MIQSLTPAGEKAVAAYDPFKDDPTFRCDPVGVRRVWGAPGTPLEIVRDGGNIVLHHEWMDVRRVVHMDMKDHPKDGPRSSLGHSIGRFDGDTLVIETANYSAGVMNQYVEAGGPADEGAAALGGAHLGRAAAPRRRAPAARRRDRTSWTHGFFKQPFPRATTEFAPSDLKIEPFNCSREGLTGTTRK